MLKFLTKFPLVIIFSAVVLSSNVASKVTCGSSRLALAQMESYYTWYYRLLHIFFSNSEVCKMEERQRKKICAEVAKACNKKLKEVNMDEIQEEIETAGVCYKQHFRTPLPDGDFWESKKNMYRCEEFELLGVTVKRFYVSNGGKPGVALIFNHSLKRTEDVKLANLVSGLEFNPWAKKKNKKPNKELDDDKKDDDDEQPKKNDPKKKDDDKKNK